MKRWLFVGRWQPLHKGHIALIKSKLDTGKHVVVGIRDTPLSDGDPYTVKQREEMIRRAFPVEHETGDLITMVLPDIEGVGYGRGVGYAVEEIDIGEEIKKISATKVRAGALDMTAESVKTYIENLNTTLFFTGLPCSGKTTICKALKPLLEEKGYNVVHLDGDEVRATLNSDLGFTDEDRAENLRRVSELCNLLNKSGHIVLASFLAPTNEVRNLIDGAVDNLHWIHVNTPSELCEERDVKGMWAEARKGERKYFTGVDAPFEVPNIEHTTISTESTVEECCEGLIRLYRL